MNKRFLLLAAALVLLSLLSAGIGNSRTVTITPRDTQNSTELQTVIPQQTAFAEAPKTEEAAVTYILNRNTKKFHLPDCESVQQMKEKNRLPVSGTRDEVIAQGYTPCQNCDP